MVRPLRVQYANAVYHVMNRGQAHRSIFLTKDDYRNFLKILEKAWQRWRFELFAYCLMGNHYHLCLKTPEASISRIMRQINGVYTQEFNRRHHRDGPLFRGRYKAMVIEEEEYLGQVIRYIHLNPVEGSLVKRPGDYPWSSHKGYVSQKSPPWLSTRKMREWFGTGSAFHEFVMEGNETSLRDLHRQKRWPIILGDEDFIERVQKRTSGSKKEHVREERQFVRPSLERILEAVSKEFGIPVSHLLEGKRGRFNEERRVALWAIREFGDYTYGQIAERVGLGSERTVGWACHTVQDKIHKDRRMRHHLKRIGLGIRQQRT